MGDVFGAGRAAAMAVKRGRVRAKRVVMAYCSAIRLESVSGNGVFCSRNDEGGLTFMLSGGVGTLIELVIFLGLKRRTIVLFGGWLED